VKEPGCDPCYCNYKEIAVMISKNTIRFRTPITQIPTKDNVRVTMDIGINFHIGRHEDSDQYNEDTAKFFYNFGPNRLEELLSEEVDEEIRSFVKTIKVAKVRDVKTELTTSIRESL
jgi:regulator of protease activity HflC (stomatin/prohibitin superfamily)